MSLIIPNTFADKSTDLQLSSLDANFTYLATQINLVNTNVNQLSTALTLGNWNITESGGSLLFKHNGINKMKLDTLGNLSVTGDLIAYETL